MHHRLFGMFEMTTFYYFLFYDNLEDEAFMFLCLGGQTDTLIAYTLWLY